MPWCIVATSQIQTRDPSFASTAVYHNHTAIWCTFFYVVIVYY